MHVTIALSQAEIEEALREYVANRTPRQAELDGGEVVVRFRFPDPDLAGDGLGATLIRQP